MGKKRCSAHPFQTFRNVGNFQTKISFDFQENWDKQKTILTPGPEKKGCRPQTLRDGDMVN